MEYLHLFENCKITEGDITFNYRKYIPDHAEGEKLPLLIFLHGAGERGDDNTKQLTNSSVMPHYFKDEIVNNFKAAVIAPQCPDEKQWVDTPWDKGDYSLDEVGETPYIKLTVKLIEELSKEDFIDESRIYVTGVSMGGYGTWNIIMTHPDLFAAAAPICGGADSSKAELVKNIPINTYHGGSDWVVPTEGTRVMVKALKAVGGNIRYTEYEGCEHNSWDNAYSEPDFFPWLFSQEK